MIIGSNEIILDICNRINILGFNGCQGKSYMYRLLETYLEDPANEDKVLIATYNRDLNIDSLVSRINSFDGELIMLDRFDLYCNDDLIKAICDKDCPILIDCKNIDIINRMPYNLCNIERISSRKIIVTAK